MKHSDSFDSVQDEGDVNLAQNHIEKLKIDLSPLHSDINRPAKEKLLFQPDKAYPGKVFLFKDYTELENEKNLDEFYMKTPTNYENLD